MLIPLLASLPIVLCTVYFMNQWKELKVTLNYENNNESPNKVVEKKIQKKISISSKEWGKRFGEAFDKFKKQVEKKNIETEKDFLKILKSLDLKMINQFAKKSFQNIKQTLENGEVQSLLMNKGSLTFYLVAIPGLHDHPNLLKRYSTFKGGCGKHLVDTFEFLNKPPEKTNTLIQFIIFLSPNEIEGLLYVGVVQNGTLILSNRLLRSDIQKNEVELMKVAYNQSL